MALAVRLPADGVGTKSAATRVGRFTEEGEAFEGLVVLGCLGAPDAGVGAPPAGRTSCTGAFCAGVQEVLGWTV